MNKRTPKILTLWFNHLKTHQEQTKFQEAVYNNNNNVVLRRLYDIVSNNMEEIDRRTSSTESYSNSAWPYLMAHMNGEKEAYKKILDLLEFTRKDL